MPCCRFYHQIFCVKPLEAHDPCVVVSCGLDGQVILSNLNRPSLDSELLTEHDRSAQKLVVLPNQTLLSAGEDGRVKLIDIRKDRAAENRATTLVTHDWAIHSIHGDPMQHHYFALALAQPVIEVFDMRKPNTPCELFCPLEVGRGLGDLSVTSVQFDYSVCLVGYTVCTRCLFMSLVCRVVDFLARTMTTMCFSSTEDTLWLQRRSLLSLPSAGVTPVHNLVVKMKKQALLRMPVRASSLMALCLLGPLLANADPTSCNIKATAIPKRWVPVVLCSMLLCFTAVCAVFGRSKALVSWASVQSLLFLAAIAAICFSGGPRMGNSSMLERATGEAT